MKQLTILNGTSLSSAALDCGVSRLLGVEMPATWTAAVLSFMVSDDGTNYYALYDQAGTNIQLVVAVSRSFSFPRDLVNQLRPWRWIALRSGTAAIPVLQLGDRVITLNLG